MTFAVRLAPPFLAVIVLLIVGCGGDEGGTPVTAIPSAPATATSVPSPAPTPIATATATPTPTPIPTPTVEAIEAPDAAPIEHDPGVNGLGEGLMQPVLAPNGVLNLEPIDLAEGLGIVPPPCAALVLYLSWQVRQPYPPDGIDLEFYWTRMGGTELIGEGPSGQANRGCGAIQVVNSSDVEVMVEIRYAIGELTG
jgi:hypothetical protein